VKVTRVACSGGVNVGKYGELVEQARRLGRVRSWVWDRYGSITGVGLSDRQIRDRWMADGTATSCGVLGNAWKETVRDAVADIRAHREAAKAEVRRRVGRRLVPEAERKQWSSRKTCRGRSPGGTSVGRTLTGGGRPGRKASPPRH
jgi:hypothetical protein